MNENTRNQFGSDEPLETVAAGERFREVLNEFVTQESDEEPAEFQERAQALVDAIYAEDDSLAGDIENVELYSARAAGDEVDQLNEFLETGVEATVNRGTLIAIVEGYSVRGVDLNVNHERVVALLNSFIATEEELPEKTDVGREAVQEIESEISDPKSPFVKANDREDSLDRDQMQAEQQNEAEDGVMIRVVDQPEQLVPIGSVVVIPVSVRTRQQRDEPLEATLSVSMPESFYGGLVDYDPVGDPPVAESVEPSLRSAVEDGEPVSSTGVGETDSERTVSLSRDDSFAGVAVYIAESGVDEVDISVASDGIDATTASESVLLQGKSEAFIEARADALDESLPWFLLGGGGVAAAGVAAGGYVLYRKMND